MTEFNGVLRLRVLGRCGCIRKNRESPQINANRIFLAPSCSAPADRLRRNRTPSGKMLSEKPACRFFYPRNIFPYSIVRKNLIILVKIRQALMKEKPARRFFP